MSGLAPELSVVIPAYNEANRLPASLARIRAHLDRAGPSYELVAVDDGSSDGTGDVARGLLAQPHRVLVNPRNRGKGYSVRRGMLAARGGRRLMSDADLSTPIEELGRLMRALDEGNDIAIGSRALPGSRIEIHQPRYRESLGRLFNRLVRLLVVDGLRDTQCGFKLFTADAAVRCFGPARLDGFSFDVETLHVARRRGLRIAELPVVWRNDAATRVTLLGGLGAFLDLVRIRLNSALGRYDDGSAPGPARHGA